MVSWQHEAGENSHIRQPEEISQILDMNERTVRVRLKRGHDKLVKEYSFVSPAVSVL